MSDVDPTPKLSTPWLQPRTDGKSIPDGINREWWRWLIATFEAIWDAVAGLGTDKVDKVPGTDNAAVRMDGTDGDIQNSAFIIDDDGDVSSFGGQITFPATQSASAGANTLDDYEESDAVVPALTFGGASVGLTYTTQTLSYTKIGRVVFFNLTIHVNSNGTSVGAAVITGLPFAAAGQFFEVTFYGQGLAAGATTALIAQVFAGGTTIELFHYAAGGITALNDTTVPDGSLMRITGFYFADN